MREPNKRLEVWTRPQWREFSDNSPAWAQIKEWLHRRRQHALESMPPLTTIDEFALKSASNDGIAKFIQDEMLNEGFFENLISTLKGE